MGVKTKSVWVCTACGHSQPKWSGQCPQCKEWNSLYEEAAVSEVSRRFDAQAADGGRPLRISEVSSEEQPRSQSGIGEFDRLIGGGVVVGSLTLIGGEPGIGKSTLMMQLAHVFAKQGAIVLYVCGEESAEQTSLRARRLGITSDNILLLCETNFGAIHRQVEALKPDILIVDSIQIMYKSEITSAPGSVAQVREVTNEFMHIAKGQGIATFLIGHVTKAGEIAGPRVLEHLVDTVLYFEGDSQQHYRMIRVVKNRFGPTDEIGVFKMEGCGLVEVPNASQIFLQERSSGIVGSVVMPTLEGSRAILVEGQALVTETAFATPSRRATGIDHNRLALLLAVMEKRVRYQLFRCDVYVSIAGGLKVVEPGIDLGVLVAVASSLRQHPIDSQTVVVGEVGLGGEVRSVIRVESRIKEAVQMGFNRCILPSRNVKGVSPDLKEKITLIGVEFVEEAIRALIN